MITPYEIENKEFKKSMKGYNIEEVDEFLDEIMLDYEKLLAENKKLKDEKDGLKKDLEEYKKSENSVLNTLESAKHLMSDISASAEKRAEIILKNARLDAESIQREAKSSIGRLSEEGEELKKKVERYRTRYRQLLTEELDNLDGSSAELFRDLDEDFFSDSKPKDDESEKTVTKQVEEPQVEEKSAIDMIMEDFKNSNVDSKSQTRVVNVKEDLTKTRIL